MTSAWSRHGLTLTWRGDELDDDCMLYAGRIYVGNIRQIRRTQRWSMFLILSPSGEDLGLRDTEQEARDGLVDAAVKALFGEDA